MPAIFNLAAATYRHLRDADPDLVEDIQKMGLWNERREKPNPGGAARAIEVSWRPITHLKEDIYVRLSKGRYPTDIRVLHYLTEDIYLAGGYILHFLLDELPDTVEQSLNGADLSKIIDLTGTSLEELKNAKISSFMRRSYDEGERRCMAYLDVKVHAMDIGEQYGRFIENGKR